MKKYFFPIGIALIYFVIGIYFLHDYGINWDSPYNFQRGQAFLHYFLTGSKTYSNLPKCTSLQGTAFLTTKQIQEKCGQNSGLLRSNYQDDLLGFSFIMKADARSGGHPPLADELEAISNTIFYRWLHILDDTDAYNLFPLLCASLFVLLVGIWATDVIGLFGGGIASLSLSLYPFLFGERNFNFKDPPTAFFFFLTLYLFWIGVTKKKYIYFLLSSLSCAVSFNMKFNIVFLPFIVIPYLIFLTVQKKTFKKDWKKYTLILLLYPIPAFLLFFAIWPYIWQSPIKNFLQTILYYKGIGTGIMYIDPKYYLFGFDLYPALFFLISTPIQMLFFATIGVYSLFRSFKIKKINATVLLWLLLFIIPILRVTIPGFSSYGGIRQILEFIGGLALLTGFGANFCVNFFAKYIGKTPTYVIKILIVASFIPLFVTLVRLHPNENLYFNSLIGGLKGAQSANIPSWNNTFGNSFYQGIAWLNKHASQNANLAYSVEGSFNYLPQSKLRPDIKADEMLWSDTQKKGEYIIESNLIDNLVNKYAKQYELKTLIPVYTMKADGVIIGYIFENDFAHTKKEYQKLESDIPISVDQENNVYIISVSQNILATKLRVTYDSTCKDRPNGVVSIYDNNNWKQLPESFGEQYFTLPNFQMGGKNNTMTYYFPYLHFDKLKISLFTDCSSKLDNFYLKGITN